MNSFAFFSLIFLVYGIFGDEIPEGDFEEGVYAIKYQDQFLSALDSGSIYPPKRIGSVSTAEWTDTYDQIWTVKKTLFVPPYSAYQGYSLGTMGPNGFNNVDLEPYATAYPEQHEFRLTPIKDTDYYLINSYWGTTCLERQGESLVRYAACDAENSNQHWEFEHIQLK